MIEVKDDRMGFEIYANGVFVSYEVYEEEAYRKALDLANKELEKLMSKTSTQENEKVKYKRDFRAVFCRGYDNYCDCKHCMKRYEDENKDLFSMRFKNGSVLSPVKVRKETIRGNGCEVIVFKKNDS